MLCKERKNISKNMLQFYFRYLKILRPFQLSIQPLLSLIIQDAKDRQLVLEIAKSCRHTVKVHARYMFCNWIASTVTQATQSAISGLLAQVIVMTIFSRMPTFRSWIAGTFIKRLGFFDSNYFRTFFHVYISCQMPSPKQ